MFQILALLDIFPDLTGLALVFEYMPYTLYSRMRDGANPLNRSEVKSLANMLLQGVNYMHNLGLMHRVFINLKFKMRNKTPI